jgi:hypothetical protein
MFWRKRIDVIPILFRIIILIFLPKKAIPRDGDREFSSINRKKTG